MERKFELNVKIDRYDKEYQQLLSNLLSIENLIENAVELPKDDKHYGKYSKKIAIKFCGLSGLSILGGTENHNGNSQRQPSVKNFLDLISNKGSIVKELNEKHSIYLDVKLLFAYPYSDFMYDLIQAEEFRHEGISIECLLEKKIYKYDFRTPNRLTYLSINKSTTVLHLINSLDKIQEAVNNGQGIINHVGQPNRVVVKFTPINILTCFLKINHHVFIDPYVYSKKNFESKILSLLSPVSYISIPEIPDNYNELSDTDKKIYEHYCSLVNHFRYLWYHPLTLYSSDATKYNKGQNRTLSDIRFPKSISYLAKSEHLGKLLSSNESYSKSEIDLWRQHCKNELIRYCSKFLKSRTDFQVGPEQAGKININPVRIFIVGAWKNNAPSEYMSLLEEFINSEFFRKNDKGMKLMPKVINAENGTEFRKLIFEGLNSSQLAIVVQTKDYHGTKIKFSRPNVYIEKGYLMGRLGKKNSRSTKEDDQEPVFVFIEKGTEDGSDTNHITQTSFTTLEYFELQFFKIVKWLWEITEINSDYTLELLEKYYEKINIEINKSTDEHRNQTLSDFLNLIRRFKTQIIDWQEEYNERINQLRNL
jgi:Predicted nucleotide-binding protein containing TIR-like domain